MTVFIPTISASCRLFFPPVAAGSPCWPSASSWWCVPATCCLLACRWWCLLALSLTVSRNTSLTVISHFPHNALQFDANGVNVALSKPAWTNYMPSGTVGNLVPAGAVDGYIDGDNVAYGNETGAFLSGACPTPLGQGASVAFWQVDLGYPGELRLNLPLSENTQSIIYISVSPLLLTS